MAEPERQGSGIAGMKEGRDELPMEAYHVRAAAAHLDGDSQGQSGKWA